MITTNDSIKYKFCKTHDDIACTSRFELKFILKVE